MYDAPTKLLLRDRSNTGYALNVSRLNELPSGKTWLWKYAAKVNMGFDVVRGVIISACTFEEANERFIKVLLDETPNSNLCEYDESEWAASVEGEDWFPERDNPVILVDYLHA